MQNLNPVPPEPGRILVLALAGIGDTLMTTPLLRELRASFPEAVMDVLVIQNSACRDILAGNPHVNEVLYRNFLSEGRWRSLAFCLALRRRRYDVSISTFPQNRLAYNAIARLIGAKARLGFDYRIRCGGLERLLLTHRIAEQPDVHVVDHNLRLLPELFHRPLTRQAHRLEIVLSEEHRRFAERWLADRTLEGKALIGFHPGSGTTKNLVLKRWGSEKWAALAVALAELPGRVIVLFGGADERALLDEIRRRAELPPETLQIAETPSILSAAALISRMQCFVCCDSLMTHLAAALEVPSVVIYGPTAESATHPYGAPYRGVKTGVYCSPCYGFSKYGIRCTNAVFLVCLKGVTSAMVKEAVEAMLAPACNSNDGQTAGSFHRR